MMGFRGVYGKDVRRGTISWTLFVNYLGSSGRFLFFDYLSVC